MADVADYTQAVNVTGGSVTILGTASVAITGTPTVAISGTPTVNVGNTPSVSITSGTVTATISGTPSINIAAQSIQVGIQAGWALVGTAGGAAGTLTTSAVPAGTQTLGIALEGAGFTITGLTVQGGSGIIYESTSQGQFGPWVTVPVNGTLDTIFTVTWNGAAGFFQVEVYASAAFLGYPALGQNPSTESVPVVLASDQQARLNGGSPGIIAFPSASRAVGTYLFAPAAGQWPAAAGILVYNTPTAGTGTCVVAIRPMAPNGISPGNTLTSASGGTGTIQYLRMYPGLPNVANQSANDLCGLNPNIQLVVSGSASTVATFVDAIP